MRFKRPCRELSRIAMRRSSAVAYFLSHFAFICPLRIHLSEMSRDFAEAAAEFSKSIDGQMWFKQRLFFSNPPCNRNVHLSNAPSSHSTLPSKQPHAAAAPALRPPARLRQRRLLRGGLGRRARAEHGGWPGAPARMASACAMLLHGAMMWQRAWAVSVGPHGW